jgi:predicted transcriptional regulator
LGFVFQNNKVLCVLVADKKRDVVGLITKSDLFKV